MTLQIRPVAPAADYYPAVRQTLNEAFPLSERVPMWVLNLLTKRRGIQFNAIFDGEQFCGLLYTAEGPQTIFVIYFAVNRQVRSQGYGGRILELLKAKGKTIVLNAERPDAQAANAAQRQNRLRFYRRQGILETGYYVDEGSESYLILSSEGTNVDLNAYRRFLRRLSFGLYRQTIKRDE